MAKKKTPQVKYSTSDEGMITVPLNKQTMPKAWAAIEKAAEPLKDATWEDIQAMIAKLDNEEDD